MFIMLLLGCYFSRISLILMVILSVVAAYPYPEEDKSFNLKVGFDLTHGDNGAPSLRIRDIEESREYSPRAGDDQNKEKKHNKASKPAVRADSSKSENNGEDHKIQVEESSDESNSKEKSITTEPKSPQKSKEGEEDENDDDDDSDTDSDPNGKHSTRGLSPREYEPEDKNPKLHGREDDDDDERRRNKRDASGYVPNKRKYNKVRRMFRKKLVTSDKPY